MSYHLRALISDANERGAFAAGGEDGGSGISCRVPAVRSRSLIPPVLCRKLEHVLRIYIQHYNRERPHRGLALEPPQPIQPEPPASGRVQRRDRLGGLVHEYYRAAA